MKILFYLSLFCFTTSYGQDVPLPPSVSSIDDIVSEFRKTLTFKLDEVGKNFISSVTGKTILFSSSERIKCNGYTVAAGQPISSLQFNYKNTPSELIEKVIYTGCNDEVSLVEDIVTKGDDLKPISYSEFIKGKRDFDLKENENFKLYKLTNSDNEELFKLLIERTPKGKIAEFFIVGQKFLTMNYEFESNLTRLVFSYPGYKGKYIRKNAMWDFDASYEPFSNTVLVKKDKTIETFFFDTKGIRFSQSDFLTKMNYFLISGPISRVRRFLEYHNSYFPSTKSVQVGSTNERLKEELRIMFNRLQNNTEINLIKRQIQDYMEAAESGFLIDNRPKQ